MRRPDFRLARADDLPGIVALNDAATPHVNALSEAMWHRAIAGEAECRVVDGGDGAIDALVVAMPPGRDYPSENYSWFQRHLGDFLYCDRIVVAAHRRKQGWGRAAYGAVFAAAGTRVVTCEVNLRPANDASLAFHGALGFREIGIQDVGGGAKRVVMLARRPGAAVEPSERGPEDGAMLRRAVARDSAELAGLWRTVSADACGSSATSPTAISTLGNADPITVVAQGEDGTLCGAVVIEAPRVDGGARARVVALGVVPVLRGRRLGARLIAAARREAMSRGWRSLTLETPSSANAFALTSFCRRNGFQAEEGDVGFVLRLS
jgi:predicted GNAT superfamily acetyltransferase